MKREFRMGERRKLVWASMMIVAWALPFLVGWDFSKHSVPLNEIRSGGPPKDGIPALLKPRFVGPRDAEKSFLKDEDRVLGLAINGEAKAYPIKILNWHEIANDKVGGHWVTVTFCPLCGTGMVFDAEIKGTRHTFGVSGLLYQSDMLLYDHQTESLWSQIQSEAVTGPLTGARLKLLPSTQTTWAAWKKKHPETRVLSHRTGHRRDYQRDPYEDYYESTRLMFGVSNRNPAYHPKERVIGIEIGGTAKVYPFSELAGSRTPIADVVEGQPIQVYYDKGSQTAVIRGENGNELPSVVGFWFAWFAFHPDTEVFKGKQ